MLTKISECLNSWPAPSRKLGDHTVLVVIEIVIALIERLKVSKIWVYFIFFYYLIFKKNPEANQSNGSGLDIETAYQLISGLIARGCHYYDVENFADENNDGR